MTVEMTNDTLKTIQNTMKDALTGLKQLMEIKSNNGDSSIMIELITRRNEIREAYNTIKDL